MTYFVKLTSVCSCLFSLKVFNFHSFLDYVMGGCQINFTVGARSYEEREDL